MSVSKAMASLFDVRPDERRLVALLIAEAFCIGLARLFGQTAQGTLFVVTFGAQS